MTETAGTLSDMISIDNTDAYVARPEAPGSYPGVILAHQLFGLTADVRAAADRIARLGYVVIARTSFTDQNGLWCLPQLPRAAPGASRSWAP